MREMRGCSSGSTDPAGWSKDGRHAVDGTRVVAVQNSESFIQIQGSAYAIQIQTQTHHRVGDFRIDSHDHRPGTTEASDVGQVSQGTGGVGIHDVEGGDVDDDARSAVLADLVDQIV